MSFEVAAPSCRACGATSRCRGTLRGAWAARPTFSTRRTTATSWPHSSPACRRSVPLLWVGLGSNLLVRDGGIRGVVICTHGAFTRLEHRAQRRVYCEAGVPCARVTRQCASWGLGQAEFFAGIPGTMGGALAMNAGAYGGETWNFVRSVDVMARSGSCRTRRAAEYQVGYRRVTAPANDEWFLAAELEFGPADPAATGAVRALAQRRKQTQPLGEWSCGSVFTNPPGDHAARLIESADLKGFRIGGAVVAEKHANFILNEGGASARDLEELIAHVRATVERVHGVSSSCPKCASSGSRSDAPAP